MDMAQTEVTLFVGHIPRHLDRELAMRWVDAAGFSGCYDFLYVPLQFGTDANRGYMFINFIEAQAARRFVNAMEGLQLGNDEPELSVWPAATQGLEGALAKWCKKSSRRIRNPRALPYVRREDGSTAARSAPKLAHGVAPESAPGDDTAVVAAKWAGPPGALVFATAPTAPTALGGGGGGSGAVRAPPGWRPPPGLDPPGRAAVEGAATRSVAKAARGPPGLFVKGGPPGLWAAGALGSARAAPAAARGLRGPPGLGRADSASTDSSVSPRHPEPGADKVSRCYPDAGTWEPRRPSFPVAGAAYTLDFRAVSVVTHWMSEGSGSDDAESTDSERQAAGVHGYLGMTKPPGVF